VKFENLLFALRYPLVTMEYVYGKYYKKKSDRLRWHLTRSKVAYLKTRSSLAELFDCSLSMVSRAKDDLDSSRILKELSKISHQAKPPPLSFAEMTIVYLTVRLLKPVIAIETGTGRGFASSAILQALEDNNMGILYSIDIKHGSGDVIPQHLKHRFVQHIGSSKDMLPKLLKDLKKCNFFLHDSIHTYEYMMFEYECVYPYMNEGDILASHNVKFPPKGKTAFEEFARENTNNISSVFIYQNLGLMRIGQSH